MNITVTPACSNVLSQPLSAPPFLHNSAYGKATTRMVRRGSPSSFGLSQIQSLCLFVTITVPWCIGVFHLTYISTKLLNFGISMIRTKYNLIISLMTKVKQRFSLKMSTSFKRVHFYRKKPPSRNYVDQSANVILKTLPPSRRAFLSELAGKSSASNQKTLIGAEPSAGLLFMDALSTSRSYDLENVPKYTPTGFSTAEIKSIGDFPAYDVLSGVRLPEPYDNFDPKKALPRPYRPFRWVYHQTMSKSIYCLLNSTLVITKW